MDKSFHIGNRKKLYETLEDGAVAVLFSGNAPRQSADAYYPFFANRNFVYLTGISGAEAAGFIFMAQKAGGNVTETIFILPPDEHLERWNGTRLKADEVRERFGIESVAYIEDFTTIFHRVINAGNYQTLWLDLEKHRPEEQPDEAHRFAFETKQRYPSINIENLYFQVRRQRTIKQPCEIEAFKEAMKVTRAGILAMMQASKPGMYEYEYKAIFDHVLADHKVLTSAFPSIISTAENNFCIHYYSYMGQTKDGDMVLNDVGACWDNICNDVSRGWPCNGKFSEKQRQLYTCAYNTSQYMFSIIKPGMPMKEVDATARRYNFEQLKTLGLCQRFEDVGKYIWHGGAHHVGYDVHDVVDMDMPVTAGMVFCVDIGIYCQEWGIGFRLEDNCLVTENGCINLSASIPRSIDEIEAVMEKK